jgi:hypothetical protein
MTLTKSKYALVSERSNCLATVPSETPLPPPHGFDLVRLIREHKCGDKIEHRDGVEL